MRDDQSDIYFPRSLYIDQRNDDLYFLDQDNKENYRVQYLLQNFSKPQAFILLTENQTRSYGMDFDRDLNIYASKSNHHPVVK